MTRDALIKDFLDYSSEEGFHVKLYDEDYVAKVGFNINNTNVSFLVFFDENGDSVEIMARDFAVVPQKMIDSMPVVINKYNRTYRWIKLEWDEQKGNLYSQIDLMTVGEECGKLIWDVIFKICGTIDSLFPHLMNDFWGDDNEKNKAKYLKTMTNDEKPSLDQVMMLAQETEDDAS